MHALLDKYLCQKYPKIFVDRNKSPMESCMHWGLAVDDGWFYLIDALCENIQHHIDNPPWVLKNDGSGEYEEPKEPIVKQVVALQVKEKFSGLRFYYSGGDEYIRGMVDLAETLSYNICEECGKMNKEVGRNSKGWIVTTCKEHARHVDDFNTNNSKELTEIWKKVHEDEEKEHQKKLDEAYTAKV